MTRGAAAEFAGYTFADHLNGNALYRVGDAAFRAVIARIEERFMAAPGDYVGCYDIALYLARKDRAVFSFEEYAAMQHRFAYTDIVQNYFRTPVDMRDVCARSPTTFLVHGRNVFASE